MLIKLSDRTPAQLERLERFFNSQNWVGVPDKSELFFYGGQLRSEEDKRAVEHPFAKLVRKTRDLKETGRERYNITLEISPYIYDMGGNNIKVPISFLAGLMQALDLFSEEFEPINLELV
ncbi:MAG TPA: hypothetical protein VGC58_02620 [Candidatus Paceibacterota bacterium]